jgi:hypothetical protein
MVLNLMQLGWHWHDCIIMTPHLFTNVVIKSDKTFYCVLLSMFYVYWGTALMVEVETDKTSSTLV